MNPFAIREYLIAGLGIALLLATGFGYLQTQRLGIAQDQHKVFVAGVEQAGKAAQFITKQRIAADKTKQKEANHENKVSIAALRADNQRLRDERSRTSYLPAPSATAKSPDRVTFDRAQLESALGRFVEDVAGIVEAGDEARVNLDTAKKWAQP